RARQWRLTAWPYPWTIQNAFDNSLATLWICGDSLRPGQYVQLDFCGSTAAGSAVMEGAPNQPAIPLRLEGRSSSGNWRVLSPAPAISDVPRPFRLRRVVAGELKRSGIDYILLFNEDNAADEFRTNADLWGARAVGSSNGAILYELQ